MKIRMTFDWSDYARRALAHRHGRSRPATGKEISDWIVATMRSVLADIEKKYEVSLRKATGEQETTGFHIDE